eukprot:3732499-Amphidinium_carterae.1
MTFTIRSKSIPKSVHEAKSPQKLQEQFVSTKFSRHRGTSGTPFPGRVPAPTKNSPSSSGQRGAGRVMAKPCGNLNTAESMKSDNSTPCTLLYMRTVVVDFGQQRDQCR